MDKVKITDIAKQSKVSPTTVSRYFNHPELLSQETQTKIEGYIERCCEKHLKTKLLICEKYGNWWNNNENDWHINFHIIEYQ